MATGISVLMLPTTNKASPRWTRRRSHQLTVQVLDDATETVAVGSDDDVLPGLDFRGDDLVPEGQGAGDGVLQGLAGGQLTWLQVLVAP